MTIIESRLAELDTITLKSGTHVPDGEMCLMEATAWIAGESWSDHPQCVCPVLAAFCRLWNDALDDNTRDRLLKPFVVRLIGTRSTPEVESKRSFLALDWLVRVQTPAWLQLAGLNDHANQLARLAPLATPDNCCAAQPLLDAAGAAAAAAAWDAAGAAAWDAAWDAAGDAARAAAGAAAWAAAGAAASDAARAAAGAALAPTVLALQVSAVDLLDRMIATTA